MKMITQKIKEAKKLKVKKYKSNNDKFINSVKKYIDELQEKKYEYKRDYSCI